MRFFCIDGRTRPVQWGLAIGTSIGALGCGHASNAASSAPANEVPASVSIGQSTVVMGVSIGTRRTVRSVGAFRISKYPVTVAQYRECTAAGGCSPPQDGACASPVANALSSPTFGLAGADAVPVTCTGIKGAQAYCAWTGGSLPTQGQWELAARGPQVTRFPWGNAPGTCAESVQALGPAGCPRTGPPVQAFAVGHHPSGASPLGVEDVLLAPGELIASGTDNDTAACSAPNSACVAYGLSPNAIDALAPIRSSEGEESSTHPYGFRCVWQGGGAK